MSLYTRIIDLQKLNAAWKSVRKRKPAAGVDRITADQFDETAAESLKQLCQELREHTYEAQPVRMTTIYREEKARDIALYCMRDKVVQQSAASELSKIYESSFPDCVYAYVSRKSALNAVGDIGKAISSGAYTCALKIDITHFFDEIDWEILRADLGRTIREEDVIELIRMNACGDYVREDTGELFKKEKGIYQGSGISPILSNIYMLDFDRWLTAQTSFCVRYADDILILGKSKEELTGLLTEISLKFQEMHLRLNEEKTRCVLLTEGIDFLGYHFDGQGQSVPAKAVENLATRLETMWLTGGDTPLEDRLRKVTEITGGWEQYYRDKRSIASVLEYAALVYSCGDDMQRIQKLADNRIAVVNEYRDIMQYLCSFWAKYQLTGLELLEYEQYYQVPGGICGMMSPERGDQTESTSAPTSGSIRYVLPSGNPAMGELLASFRKYRITETRDLALDIMQCYADLKHYEAASFWMKQSEKLNRQTRQEPAPILNTARGSGQEAPAFEPVFNDRTPEKFLHTFAGREDLYSRDAVGGMKNRQNVTQTQPLTVDLIREHLKGNLTLGTYIQRPNATVHNIVFDVDISRKVLLQYEGQQETRRAVFETCLNKAYQVSAEICRQLDQMGMKGYIEFSGYRGYHVWLFLTEWIPVRYANLFCDIMEKKVKTEEDITIESFPNRTRLKPGHFGQTIKLPYGVHPVSGRRSCFLDKDGRPVADINGFADGLAKFSGGAVRKVLAMNSGSKEAIEKKDVDQDLTAFSGADETVLEVLRNCSLMRYLCQKAVKTGYLTHFERMSVLYVFGHLGEPGQRFIHDVMSHTLNYSYNTTERFIRKCPEKPISCVKLQDQYKKITAEIGCNCVFKQKKNFYPSPVLHAILLSPAAGSDITLPTSRTISVEKKQEVLDDVNIHKKAQALAKQILEFKRQKRSLDRSIRDVERQLSEIFDNAGIDCLETEIGVLVRKKKDGGYDWVIEL